jgi:hypothetical protein
MTGIDTLCKLRDHGYTVEGYCIACAKLYRKAPPDEPQPPSFFAIDLGALVAEHGADRAIAVMPRLACPYCGSRQTSVIVSPPERAPAR